MALQKTYPLGPWPLGIDNVSAPSRLAMNDRGRFIAVTDAVNVDIDRNGWPARCAGYAQTAAQAGLTDLWARPEGAFARAGATLFSVRPNGLDAIATLNTADPVTFAVVAGDVIAANRTTLLRIRNGVAQPLCIPDCTALHAAAAAAGGLTEGRYVVAAAFLRGDVEGGLSALRTVDVPQGGGIQLGNLPTAPDVTGVRLYRTEPNGETLYRVGDVAPGLVQYLIGIGPIGTDAPAQWLRRMPSGGLVDAWRGRLLVAHGRTLYVSEPMAPHLHDRRHGFVQFAHRITMLAPVDGGVFVGTKRGVEFLRGARPKEWTREVTGALPPVPGASVPLDGNLLNRELGLGGQLLRAWLAPNGFVVATPAGNLLEMQAERLMIPAHARASIAVQGRRITAAVA